MSKIELLPGEKFPTGTGLSARVSRNGMVISTQEAATKKKRKTPTVASELSKMPDCLKAARLSWGSLDPGTKNSLISMMPVLCQLRFPSGKKTPSDFNRFLNLFAGYYFGNYYANGPLQWHFGGNYIDLPNRVHDFPSPGYLSYADFYLSFDFDWVRGYNPIFENIIIDLNTVTISFDIAFNESMINGYKPRNISFAFSSAEQYCGLCFYVSIPGLTSRPFQDSSHRLIIASFLPMQNYDYGSPFTVVSPFSFSGPLSKYYDFSTLDLISGNEVEITVFAVDIGGQSHNLGTYTGTVV